MKKLYFTIFEKPKGNFYGEIFDRKGEDVAFTEAYPTRSEAKHEAVALIAELGALQVEEKP